MASEVKLNSTNLMEHMKVLHDECQRLAKDQPVLNEQLLNNSISTLEYALNEIRSGCLTGDLETRLLHLFDDSVLVNVNHSILAAYRELSNVYKIVKWRNRFFDQCQLLDPRNKTIFEPFLNAHKLAVRSLQKQFKIDLTQCPFLLRNIVRKIEPLAYRVE